MSTISLLWKASVDFHFVEQLSLKPLSARLRFILYCIQVYCEYV